MNKKTILLFLGIVLFSSAIHADFLTEQRRFQRVRSAINEKQDFLQRKLYENQITLENLNLVFVVYKDNDLLDVYAKTNRQTTYKKILFYKICSRSGQLGPKKKRR